MFLPPAGLFLPFPPFTSRSFCLGVPFFFLPLPSLSFLLPLLAFAPSFFPDFEALFFADFSPVPFFGVFASLVPFCDDFVGGGFGPRLPLFLFELGAFGALGVLLGVFFVFLSLVFDLALFFVTFLPPDALVSRFLGSLSPLASAFFFWSRGFPPFAEFSPSLPLARVFHRLFLSLWAWAPSFLPCQFSPFAH